MSREIRESNTVLRKRSIQIFLGTLAFLLFWGFVMPKQTGAWVNFPINSYWMLLPIIGLGVPALIWIGSRVFNRVK